MTEQEWLACADPKRMLEHLGGRASDRKLRLFAVACSRRIWPRMADARSRHAVKLAERSADEPVSDAELDAASGEAEEAYEDSLTDDEGKAVGDNDPRPDAAGAASYASSPGKLGVEHFSVVLEAGRAASLVGAVQERAAQAALLRDIFGSPFRPVTTSPDWQTPQVVALAQAAYDGRLLPSGELDPTRLAVLADALEEAGCTEQTILKHLRGPGPHVRGCWVVDLLLGKS